MLEGFTPYIKEDIVKYEKRRWWLGMTWGDVFDKATDLYPGKVGFVDDVGSYTYFEMREKVDRLAISLIKLGIKQTDRVLVQLPNWHEFICAFFAIQKIGAIVVLLIPRHNENEIKLFCSLTKPVAWVLPEQYGKLEYESLIDAVCEENDQLKHIIQVRSGGDAKHLTMEGLIEKAELTKENLEALEIRRPDPNEVAQIMPTGGTTGTPKLSPRTHNNYMVNVEYHAKSWEITSNDTVIVVTPVGHGMALHWGIGGSLFNQAKLVLLDSVKPDDICAAIEKEKVTAMPTVPALLARIVEMEEFGRYRLDSLKKVSVGGAPSTPELVRTVEEKIGCKFVNGFGSVEGTTCSTRLGDSIELICYSVGKPDCPYDNLKIIDLEGKEVPQGVDGELVSKGPGVFTGYFKSPEENKNVFTSDGFFRTGDQARKDEFGNIWITGRIKDIIIRGGENVSAKDIENLMSTHPDIADSAVVGMPDKILGERICAYVVTRGEAMLTFEDIITFLKGNGASVLQLPERIEFVGTLPLTNIGKVDKKALREDIKVRLGLGE